LNQVETSLKLIQSKIQSLLQQQEELLDRRKELEDEIKRKAKSGCSFEKTWHLESKKSGSN